MAHGRAGDVEHRPRPEAANWALAVMALWVGLGLIARDGTYVFPAVTCFALWLQCRQRIVVDGRFVRRIGLRPVVLDLNTAEVVCAGRAWWSELFFWAPSLQLRDADGHRLYLESWLWDATTRCTFVEAVTRDAHS